MKQSQTERNKKREEEWKKFYIYIYAISTALERINPRIPTKK